jgi:hypothetical protein
MPARSISRALIRKDLEELYMASAWPLERKFGGPSTAFDAFKLAIT